MYWTDIARMGNRDLPVYVMPDSGMPEKSYHWNNFYLLLAAGVDGLSYFIDQEGWVTPEFWEVAENKLGPVAEKFGSLFVHLKPEKYKVGLLSSFTTASYNNYYPLDDGICAYNNLIMAHVDVETVSEEELLAGRLGQYDAIVMSNVDWLRNDLFELLSGGKTNIILDQNSEIPLQGSQVTKLNFNFAEGICTARRMQETMLSLLA